MAQFEKVMTKAKSVGILGAGAFGTALAFVYHAKFNVTLFSCFSEQVSSITRTRVSEFFSGFTIPDDVQIRLASDFKKYEYDYLFWALPIKPTAGILEDLKMQLDGTNVIVCSKGLFPDSSFVCDLFLKKLPSSNVGYLAGANFAAELATGKISTADLAFQNLGVAGVFAKELTTACFRLSPTSDMVGVQVSGAIKNIVAIACGIAYGLELGENAHAALITMALSEMSELGVRLGAKLETFYGFSGLGDLVLTASSAKSRNMSLGLELARGKPVDEILESSTCEGYDTLPQVITLASRNNVDLPICNVVYKIIFENYSPSIIADVIK